MLALRNGLDEIKRDIMALEQQKANKAAEIMSYTPARMALITKRYVKENPEIASALSGYKYPADRARVLATLKPTRESLIKDESAIIQQKINDLAASAMDMQRRIDAEFSIPKNVDNPDFVSGKEYEAKIDKPNRAIFLSTAKTTGQDYINYSNKMNKELPRDYPYFVQSKFKIYTVRLSEGGGKPTTSVEIRYEPFVTKIINRLTRNDYIDSLIERVFTYNYTSEPTPMMAGYVQDIEFKIYRNNGVQKLIKVAKYYMGNCLINIVKDHPKAKDIFKRLPHLKPTEVIPNPEISEDDVVILARILKAHFTIYSKLGSKTFQPWKEFGTKGKGRQYHVVFSGGHATMMERKFNIDSIVYLDNVDDPESYTDVVDAGFEPPEGPNDYRPLYYVRFIDNKFVMYKTFRPSSFTLNPKDDEDTYLSYTTNKVQVASRIFKKMYFGPLSSSIKDMVKSAEHFITRRLFSTPTDRTEFIDSNKCFVSYKKNPYYDGFPTHELYPIIGDRNDARFSAVTIENVPKCFQLLTMYKDGTIILPTPVVRYLQTISNVTIKYSLIGPTRDIDIIEFADHYKNVLNESQIKKFRNSIIGYSIAGGMKETKKLQCRYSTQAELDQLIHECDVNGLTFSVQDIYKTITIDYKNVTNGAFHFHSYILGYALITMSSMMSQLLQLGLDIVGYNVDAILYNNPERKKIEHSDDPIGGWKIESIQDKHDNLKCKSYYYNYPISTDVPRTYTQDMDIKLPNRPIGNILITGAAGVSKSYPYILDPHFDQVLLTFTKRLAKRHKETAAELNSPCKVFTAAKYFQFGTMQHPVSDLNWYGMRSRGTIPQRHKIVVVDEFTMYSKFQWDIMIRRASADNSFIVALGDPEQISNAIGDVSIDVKYFADRKFTVIDKKRVKEEERYHRHDFADGSILDSLRSQKTYRQVEELREHCATVNTKDINFVNSIFITDNHKKCNYVNLLARDYCIKNKTPFPVKDRKGSILHLMIDQPSVNAKIWWDKIKMCSDKDFPKQFLYEPAFAVTADSVQGETVDKIVYVDSGICRRGAFYTAVTRTFTDRTNGVSALDKIKIVIDPDEFDESNEFDEPNEPDESKEITADLPGNVVKSVLAICKDHYDEKTFRFESNKKDQFFFKRLIPDSKPCEYCKREHTTDNTVAVKVVNRGKNLVIMKYCRHDELEHYEVIGIVHNFNYS